MSGRGRPAENPERRQRRQEAMLAAFRETGLAITAAKQAGVPPPQHYRWLKEDADYAKRFAELKEQTAGLTRQVRQRPGPKTGSHPGGERAIRTAEAQEAFLAAFARCGVAGEASRETGVPTGTHQSWLQRDPQYAQRFKQVKAQIQDLRRQRISQRLSDAGKARWADPDERRAWGEYQRNAWTPERRAEAAVRLRERMEDPGERERWLEAARAVAGTPEARAANSERMKRLWEDPAYRERYQAAIDNPERRARLSEAAKAQWAALTPDEQEAKLRHMRRAFKGGHKLTSLESAVMVALNDRDVPYVVHKQIGRYVADILIPSLHLVIECDGAWFHAQRQASDEERDEELQTLGFSTLRLSEEEIKAQDWGRLDERLAQLTQ